MFELLSSGNKGAVGQARVICKSQLEQARERSARGACVGVSSKDRVQGMSRASQAIHLHTH